MEAKTYQREEKDCEYSDNEYNDAKLTENLTENNLFKQYCHDIRNFKKFNRETLEKINTFSYDNRLKILIVYNEMVEHYISLLDEK
jgi:hypothetical protein